MLVSKSIGNVEVVVQSGTAQGFTKHKTLCYTGDNKRVSQRGRGGGKLREENAQQKRRGGGWLKNNYSWVTREKQGHIICGRATRGWEHN